MKLNSPSQGEAQRVIFTGTHVKDGCHAATAASRRLRDQCNPGAHHTGICILRLILASIGQLRNE